MFPRQNIQTLIIQEDLLRPKKHDFFKPRQKYHSFVKDKAKTYFKVILKTVSIHGMAHLVARRRHYMEIILWLSILVVSAAGSLYLSSLTWIRYQSSPTVISLDKNMLAWNTSFPSVTLCPDSVSYIDKNKLEIYLRNSKDENKTRLLNFINSLANATYKSFEYITEYPEIPSDKYMDLLVNLFSPLKAKLIIDETTNIVFVIIPTITEMGYCFAVNSRTAIYNSPEYRAANRWDILSNEKDTLNIHPQDGEVFAKLVFDISAPLKVYIHGPQEMPEITSKFQILIPEDYITLYVTALTVYTSEEAAKLSVNQRRCRFPEENNLKHNTIYTYNICRMECRIRLCLEYCQCIPHFYRRIGDEKVCNVEGLHCLSKYKDTLNTLRDGNGNKINCGCFPLCDDVNYVLPVGTPGKIGTSGTNLQWGIVNYPRERYRRDIIFGFTDVLVAVGSMAGLFLGCNVLSFMEIIYFLTLRLFCYTYTYDHSNSK